MGLGVREAEMDEQGNVKLLPTNYLNDRDVSHVHNLNAKQMIAFVLSDKNVYLIDKQDKLTGNPTAIAYLKGDPIYYCI